MRDTLQKRCDLFIQNRDILKKTIGLESLYIYPVCANVLAGRDRVVTADTLLSSKKALSAEAGIFSNFRGLARLPMITLLASTGQPDEKMQRAMEIYKKLKREFIGTSFLALVAMIMTDMVSVSEADHYIKRGRTIYNRMKSEHPFLTSSEDSVFAVLMAFADKTDDELICEMEEAYNIMKSQAASKNSVQSLSHVLALTDGNIKEKCERVNAIYDGLLRRGRKYGKHYEYAVLGAAAILPVDVNTLVEEILEVDTFLSHQKGYGFWSVDKKTRLMHAAMIVASEHSESSGNIGGDIAAMTGTLAMIAAQQAAMCAIIASSAASSASH